MRTEAHEPPVSTQGVVHGALSAASIFLSDTMWLHLAPPRLWLPSPSSVSPPRVPNPIPLTTQWCEGTISNFQYLIALNLACGRSMADARCHPVGVGGAHRHSAATVATLCIAPHTLLRLLSPA